MERQRQRHKRLSLLEMTSNEKSGMGHAWVTRARTVLGRLIEHDPVKKDQKIALLRAFLIWSERLPLFQKCNELGRQLQERHLMLTTVKDSYIRDVISVKYQLRRVYELLKQQSEICELESIPSPDLRNLIERVTSATSTSFQLQDALLVSGLVNEDELIATGAIPWEQTRLYAEVKQLDTETTFRTYHGGCCISLHAPSRHKLYIKYCKECVGVMNFVREWNEDVEKAFKNALQEKQNRELKRTVNSLNDLIIAQGAEMTAMKNEYDLLKNANAWFESWHDTSAEDATARAARLRTQLQIERNRTWMAMEDMNMSKIVMNEELLQCDDTIASLQDTLQNTTASYEAELRELNVKYAAALGVIEKQKTSVVDMEKQVADAREEVILCRNEVNALEKNKNMLLALVTEKDNIFDGYKADTDEQIAALQEKINSMTNDYDLLQKQNDDLNDSLCEYRDRIRDLEQRQVEVKEDDSVHSIETFANEDELDAAYEAEMAKRDDIASRIRSVIDIIPQHVRQTISKNIEKSMHSSIGFMPSHSVVFSSVGESDDAGDALDEAEDCSILKPSEMMARSATPSRRTIVTQQSLPGRVESPSVEYSHPASPIAGDVSIEEQADTLQSLTTFDNTEITLKSTDSPSIDAPAMPRVTTTSAPRVSVVSSSRPSTISSPRISVVASSSADANDAKSGMPTGRRTVRQSFRKGSRLSRRLTRSVSRVDSLQPTLEEDEMCEEISDADIIELKYRELAAAKLYNAKYENFQVGVVNLIETVQPYIRLRLTLRAVAICVLFTVRFRRAVDGGEIKYHLLGALGRRHQINAIEAANRQLQEEVDALKKSNCDLTGNVEHLKKRIEVLKQQKKEVEQRLAIRERDFQQSKLVKVNYTEEYNELKLDLMRQRIISQAQRSLADRLAGVLHAVRQRIYLLLHGMDNRSVSALTMLGQGIVKRQESSEKLQDESEEMVKQRRMKHLRKKFKHAFKDVVEWLRSHRHERAIRPFHIKAYGDFNVFGSRLRNEEKVIGHCSTLIMSELAQLESKFGYKMSLLSEMEASMRQMEEDFKLQVDARMKELNALEKQRRDALSTVCKPAPIVITNQVEVPAPKVSPVPQLPLQSFDSHRSSPSLPQSSHRQDPQDVSARSARQIADDAIQKQYDDLIIDYEFLRRQNIVLRTAVNDSYRVQVFDNDDKERQRIDHEKQQRELARKLRQERIHHRGTQVSCAVCSIREHETMLTQDTDDDVILIARASPYLQRMEQLEMLTARPVSAKRSPRRPVSAQMRNSASDGPNKFAKMKNIPLKKSSPRALVEPNIVRMASYLQYDSNIQDTVLPTERRQTAQYVQRITFNERVGLDGSKTNPASSPTMQGWMS